MKYKSCLGIFFLLLSSFLNSSVLYAQTQTMTDKEMMELKPERTLVIELQKLINKVSNCDYYDTGLIWNIGISQAENSCILNITMQDNINLDYDYVGFFYLGKIRFVISGIIDNSLFTLLKSKKLKFRTKISSENRILETPSGDYPNWIYCSKENRLIQVKEYLIPCE